MKLELCLFQKYIWKNKAGKQMLYVKLKNALYGTLQLAILFCKLLSDILIGWGFKLNEHDQCVANKIINSKQCTIVWHVDDPKISHVEAKVVEVVIMKLTSKFRKDSPLGTSQLKVLKYLGMTIDYATKDKLKISMYKYIYKMLAELPSDMNGLAKTPAATHLFNVNPEAKKLSEEKGQLFHHLVAKLLYLCRRTRQDIKTAVAFYAQGYSHQMRTTTTNKQS